MEQLMNTLLANVQIPQAVPTVKKGESGQVDDFQKLLEQKTDTPLEPKQEKAEGSDKSQEAQDTSSTEKADREPVENQGAVTDDKELEDRMLLAAMEMLQNPVVPVEQVMTPPEEVQVEAVIVTEEAAPLMEETVPETEVLPQETAEIPVEDQGPVQTVDRSLAEEVPQPIEAPEVPQETEERTVEIKTETGDVHPEAEQTEKPVVENAEKPVEEEHEVQEADVEAPVFGEVEAAPVKVGEAPKTEEAPKPMEEQIAPKVAQALQDGDTHVEIQLNPQNLGKVTVEMTLSKDGNLVIQLHAENRETQNLLSRNTSGLEALLSRETTQEVRVEVPREEEKHELYDQQQNQHKQQQQEQQEHRQSRQGDSENFLQQLRLGLIPMDEEEF